MTLSNFTLSSSSSPTLKHIAEEGDEGLTTLPVDPVYDVVEDQVAEELQTNVSWQRSDPPLSPFLAPVQSIRLKRKYFQSEKEYRFDYLRFKVPSFA